MKLKEKFIKCKNKYDEYYILPVVDDAEQLVKVAEEFAIGFGEYIDSLTTEDMGTLSIKELLEIYKKTL